MAASSATESPTSPARRSAPRRSAERSST
jgi:hypothetical protein